MFEKEKYFTACGTIQQFYKMTNDYYNEWIDFYRDSGLSSDWEGKYKKYIFGFFQKGIPPIFEIEHLSKLLGRKRSYLASAINATNRHYRTFSIPKRRGGKRKIDAPYPALLECQQWINEYILSLVGTHTNAHGFISERSIITNAKTHLNKKFLLKLDLQNFFPSIKFRQVMRVFRQLGYPQNVSFYLSKLCTLQGSLPQGAATSPALSNIIAYGMDVRLNAIATKFNLVYSRYADDLAFSGNYIPIKFISFCRNIIGECGFSLNDSKTKITRGTRKIITGLSVGGQSLRVPRAYKRSLRQEFYYIQKYGINSHISNNKIRHPYYLESLYGKFQFWQTVEPSSKFCQDALEFLRGLLISTQ